MKMYGLILNRLEREPEKSSVDNVAASLASRDDKTREKLCARYPHFPPITRRERASGRIIRANFPRA